MADSELQRFIEGETQKQKLQTVIHELTEKCWDTCVDGKPSSKLSGKNENCLKNCVERFLDTNILVTERLTQKAEQLSATDYQN